MLQYHSTPWMAGDWTKDNLRLLTDGSKGLKSVIHRNYDHQSATFKGSLGLHDAAEGGDNQEEILSLGIFLLELLYQESFSHQLTRVNDGECPDDVFSRLIAAQEWADDVPPKNQLRQLNFVDVVKHCLSPTFGPSFGSDSTSLQNSEFREAVYSYIVEPLERLARYATPAVKA